MFFLTLVFPPKHFSDLEIPKGKQEVTIVPAQTL
jgi:hypothetical protein